MKAPFFIYTLLLTLPLTAFSAVYKEEGEDGTTSFSDTQTPGSTPIELPPIQTFEAGPPPPPPTPKIIPKAPETPAYEVTIMDPPDNTHLDPTEWATISASVRPDLAEGDKLQLVLDGKAVGDPQTSTVFKIQWLPRGQHSVVVQVLSSKGKVLKASSTITVYQKRPLVNTKAPPR